jgi:monoamine oxidase
VSLTEYDFNQQMTMFQPVGGIDQIAKAFEKRVGNKITYEAEVGIPEVILGIGAIFLDDSIANSYSSSLSVRR